MRIPLLQIDAFTEVPFRGNPAAVCLLEVARDENWMQDVAAEMNLAETAFVLPDGRDYGLRWFTPKAEVALCGHATLATAHALWETGRLARDAVARFHTKSGLLTAVQTGGGIMLDFPATPPTEAEPPGGLFEALGLDPAAVRYVGRSTFDFLLEVDRESVVRGLSPDFGKLSGVPARGIIVTSLAERGSDYDVVSRFFAPAFGVNEDPVTGSAHCCLGPYFAAKTGLRDLRAFQASSRGGRVGVAVRGDRVELTGRGVTILRGELAD